MKNSILSAFAALLGFLPSAFALPTVTFADGAGTTGGGEFLATSSEHGSFLTFCLEYQEHIYLGKQYYYEVSQAARWNGNGTVDPLSRATAWLYLQFLDGTLASFGSSYAYSHTSTKANDLQRAIWYLEGESYGVKNYYADLALSNATDATANNNGFYGVGVMNLWERADGTGAGQDQLIRYSVPDGGMTVLLLGLGLGSVAWFAPRRQQA